MVFVSIKPELKDLQELAKQLSDKQLNAVLIRGINKTLMLGRTEARSNVKSQYNIPQKNISSVDISRASGIKPHGSIFAPVAKVSMNTFSPKYETTSFSVSIGKRGDRKKRDFKRNKKSPAMGVSIEVIKGKRTVVPFAFMAKNKDLKKVFARGNYNSSGHFEVRNYW
jgi:hypothetical protein